MEKILFFCLFSALFPCSWAWAQNVALPDGNKIYTEADIVWNPTEGSAKDHNGKPVTGTILMSIDKVSVLREFQVREGLQDGRERHFRDGNLLTEQYFKKGKIQYTRHYDPEGKLASEIYYIDSRPQREQP